MGRCQGEDQTREGEWAIPSPCSSVALELGWGIGEPGRLKEACVDWIGEVQTQNMHYINKSVDDYDSNIDIARFVRDTCGVGLMIGASVMSGGTVVAVMVGGSF